MSWPWHHADLSSWLTKVTSSKHSCSWGPYPLFGGILGSRKYVIGYLFLWTDYFNSLFVEQPTGQTRNNSARIIFSRWQAHLATQLTCCQTSHWLQDCNTDYCCLHGLIRRLNTGCNKPKHFWARSPWKLVKRKIKERKHKKDAINTQSGRQTGWTIKILLTRCLEKSTSGSLLTFPVI